MRRLLGTVLIMSFVVVCGCNGGSLAGLNGKDRDSSNKSDTKKPSEEGEGVPGYLTDPKLVDVRGTIDGSGVTVKGKPGAVASDDGDPTKVMVYVWQVTRPELKKLSGTDATVELTGVLKDSLAANADGSFEMTITAEADLPIVVSTAGDVTRGPTFDRSDASRVSGAIVTLTPGEQTFGYGNGTFAAGTDLPGTEGTVALAAWRATPASPLGLARVTVGKELIIQSGDGTGVFTAATVVDTLPAETTSLVVADMNQDFVADLIAGPEGYAAQLYAGTSAESDDQRYGDMTPVGTDAFGNEELLATDLTGDGHADLLIGNSKNEPSRLHPGNGDATFAAAVNVGEAPTNARAALASGDVNGDGHSDVVFGTWSQGVQILTGDGAGGYTQTLNLDIDGDQVCRDVALGDYDNDGDLDIFTANKDNNFIFLNKGDGTFERSAPLGAQRNSVAAVAADLNGDGALDLVVKNLSTPSQIFLNAGDGKFDAGSDLGTDVLTGNVIVGGLIVADANDDHILDVILANSVKGKSNKLYLGK